MRSPYCLLLLATACAGAAPAKELPRPTTPSPGLRYYYPVPKAAEPQTYDFDVVIYGASPAAVSAACQAKKMGRSAAIFVFRRHVGGMSSSGLSDVDYGKKEAIGGMAKKVFLDFFKKQVQSPAEVETLFLTMLADLDIPVFFEHRLERVERDGARITKVVFENGHAARGKVFMDTTYEGDLLARAGVAHVAGREAGAEFGEKLNGVQIGARSRFRNTQAPPALAVARLAQDPSQSPLSLPVALSPPAAALFDSWVARYTMASERRVHATVLGLPFTEAENDAPAEGDIELF